MSDSTLIRVDRKYKEQLERERQTMSRLLGSDITLPELTRIKSNSSDNIVVIAPKRRRKEKMENVFRIV